MDGEEIGGIRGREVRKSDREGIEGIEDQEMRKLDGKEIEEIGDWEVGSGKQEAGSWMTRRLKRLEVGKQERGREWKG